MGSGYGSLNRQINNRVGVIKKSAPYQPLTPVQDEEVVSLDSSFESEDPFVSTVDQAEITAEGSQASIADLYNNWLLNTEQGQRSSITGYTPSVELPASVPETTAPAAGSIPPEQLARLLEMDLSFGDNILGLDTGDIAESVSMFSRETNTRT